MCAALPPPCPTLTTLPAVPTFQPVLDPLGGGPPGCLPWLAPPALSFSYVLRPEFLVWSGSPVRLRRKIFFSQKIICEGRVLGRGTTVARDTHSRLTRHEYSN